MSKEMGISWPGAKVSMGNLAEIQFLSLLKAAAVMSDKGRLPTFLTIAGILTIGSAGDTERGAGPEMSLMPMRMSSDSLRAAGVMGAGDIVLIEDEVKAGDAGSETTGDIKGPGNGEGESSLRLLMRGPELEGSDPDEPSSS